ncbi:SET domain-containing protein [Delitschia confertaspora ATCC 74209]|uniref:SET domain-containing protein n=1 Tax=Delitschia confertaspora ATCC 74209 TaxID=1513339 RepID=A0A9P4MS54_9PLEO|nr:SET domain-containing protein [Delitschia confertaspora ATCC 74209]
MTTVLSPGEEHDRFIEWAQEQGIQINGVAPAKFVGRGMGIVAARDLKKGEKLVSVPTSAILNIDTKSVKDCDFPRNISVHGRLAGYIALEHENRKSTFQPWQDVWPTKAEFNEIMPLNWEKSLQELLPEPAKDLLNAQCKKLEKDWSDLQSHLGSKVTKSLFTYAWLIVNTRCFYWDYPNLPASRLPKKRGHLTADDCYGLCPFMDYFNHADEGCDPDHDAKGYFVTANRDYKAGEEIYVTYGPHTNDFLLVEYGFILTSNRSDGTRLDHLIFSKLSKEQAEILKEDGFYGKYSSTATPPSICYRTQTALRLLTLPSRRYTAFISGNDDGSVDQPAVNSYLKKLLEGYQREIMAMEERVGELEKGVGAAQKDVLAKRWRQLREMVGTFVKELST